MSDRADQMETNVPDMAKKAGDEWPERRRISTMVWGLALITTVVIASLSVLSDFTRNMAERHGPLVNAGMHLKLETAMFHGAFHEVMEDSQKFRPEQAWDHLEAARRYGQAMLTGSIQEDFVLEPVKDPVLRSAVEGTMRMLDRLDRLAWEIAVDDEAALARPEEERRIQEAFDNVFLTVLENADHVEEAISSQIKRNRRDYILLYWAITALVIVLAIVAGAMLVRYESRIHRDRKKMVEHIVHRRTVVDSMADALVTIDEAGRIESFNPAAEHMFGYTEEEVSGKGFDMLMSKAYRAEHGGWLETVNASGRSGRSPDRPHVAEGMRRDCTVFPLEGFFSEMHIGDRLMYLATLRDITKHREAEAALEAAHGALELRVQQLERRKLEIQSFYHTLSHELKTPLTAAKEFSLIIRDGIAGPVTDDQREYLGEIEESFLQMQVIIDDLVDSARIETGKLALDFKPCSVEHIVEHSIRSVQAQADVNGVHLSWQVASLVPEVMADSNRVTQVLTNLMNNALRYTERDGEVIVRVSRPIDTPDLVKFAVRDTGCGMTPEQVEHVFDRFYQVEKYQYTHQGFGMGLYICKELVRLHGGKINVISSPGVGTEFSFTIPAHEAARATADVA